jgi:hypothetical protein
VSDSGSGIEDLVDHPDELLGEVFKHFRRNAAAKAGRGNAKRLARLKDLAFKVYADECFNNLQILPASHQKIADVRARGGLLNPLRPAYKAFYQKFLEAASNESWGDAEQKWLKRLELAEFTESTLYDWWKSFNKDLVLILNKEIYRDADGNLVFNATSPK